MFLYEQGNNRKLNLKFWTKLEIVTNAAIIILLAGLNCLGINEIVCTPLFSPFLYSILVARVINTTDGEFMENCWPPLLLAVVHLLLIDLSLLVDFTTFTQPGRQLSVGRNNSLYTATINNPNRCFPLTPKPTLVCQTHPKQNFYCTVDVFISNVCHFCSLTSC